MGKTRKIYLIRHGEIYEEGEPRRCLGHTDVPLTKRGERQAGKAAEWFQDKEIERIFTSPLQRCVKTAQIIVGQQEASGQRIGIEIMGDLQEINAGKWENLSFETIREEYPEEYEARGRELGYYAFPGGESFHQAGIRFGKCVEEIRKEVEGNFLIAAHAGVIRGYLCGLLGISANEVFTIPQPCTGITILRETGGKLVPEKTGWKWAAFLDGEEIQYLYRKCKTPERTIRHMEAVAQFISVLEARMKPSDYNWELLKKAALVHDICRAQRQHAAAGADVLRKEGYEEIAKLVEGHHSNEGFAKTDFEGLTEEELLFYADKRVQEERIVSLEERFKASMWKCRTSEAKEKHCRLYEKAMGIEIKLENLVGGKGQ